MKPYKGTAAEKTCLGSRGPSPATSTSAPLAGSSEQCGIQGMCTYECAKNKVSHSPCPPTKNSGISKVEFSEIWLMSTTVMLPRISISANTRSNKLVGSVYSTAKNNSEVYTSGSIILSKNRFSCRLMAAKRARYSWRSCLVIAYRWHDPCDEHPNAPELCGLPQRRTQCADSDVVYMMSWRRRQVP